MPSTTQTYFDEKTKIWTSNTRPYTFGDRSVGEVIFETLGRDPDDIIEINHDTGFTLTRGQLLRNSVSMSRTYQELGIKADDLVMFSLGYQNYNSALMIGASFIGAIFCDLELGMDQHTLGYLLPQLKPKIVIVEPSELENYTAVLKKLGMDIPIYVADDQHPDTVQPLLKDHGPIGDFKPLEIRDVENKVAAVVASSATTGIYKPVSISHPMLMHNYCSDFGIVKTAFSSSPLNWVTACVLIVGTAILPIKRIHSAQPFDPELFLEILEKYEVNLLIIQPDRLNSLLQCEKIKTTNLDSLYIVAATGKPLHPSMKHQLEAYLPNGGVVATYGTTEAGGTITSTLYASGKDGSVGILVDNCKAKVVNDNGELMGPGEVGELYILTEFKFLGYYKNKKLTDEVLAEDGFVKTDDMGYFDEDGELFIVDRKKDTIVMGEKLVFPSVLEAILATHPAVYDCCIIDVAHPELSFVPVAAVIRKKGMHVTEDELVEYVAARQPDDLSLKGGVLFVEQLPKTTSGKFKRYQVRKLVERSISAPAETAR